MIMRKFIYSILAVAGAVLMVSCQKQKSAEVETLQREIDSLMLVNAHTKADYEQMIVVITEVQSALAEIKSAEKILVMASNPGDDIDPNAKNQIIEDITQIANILKENRAKIDQLQKLLKDSKNESAELKQAINSLNEMIEEKGKVISELQEELAKRDIRIAELDDAITSLTQMNTVQANVILSQDSELNRVYYAFGTSKELREQKIIAKRGRGLLKGNFNQDYFTAIDMRETTSLPIGCKKAEVLTTHPNGSYSLDKDANGLLILNISDPKLFWSTSPYLVIQVE